MGALEDLKDRWAHKRFQRAARQYQATLEPHIDLIESTSGQLGMLMVQLAALGNAPPAALTEIIRQESIKSGIPEEALAAQASFSREFLTCFEFDQQLNKSPR
jgi:hypothetical protein